MAEMPGIPSGEPQPWIPAFAGIHGCSAGMTVVQKSPFAGVTEVGDLDGPKGSAATRMLVFFITD